MWVSFLFGFGFTLMRFRSCEGGCVGVCVLIYTVSIQ